MDAYSLLRPLLFKLDPERAHALTGALLPWLPAQPRVSDAVRLMGIDFPNRVGLAAGFDKNAEWLHPLARIGFGFVEVGTVTPQPQEGNARPRLFRLPEAEAVVNRMGFNNGGIDAYAARLAQRPPRDKLVVGANIGKNKTTPNESAADDYLACYRRVLDHADYVTVNVSSPNTAGLRDLQGEEALGVLLSSLLEVRATAGREGVPLLVKCAPDLDAQGLDGLAAVVARLSLDGVVATNTTLSRAGVEGLAHAEESGGMSGRPLFPKSVAVVRALRERLGSGTTIIGVGGIASADDARAMREAGADLLQVYSALVFQGPSVVGRLAVA